MFTLGLAAKARLSGTVSRFSVLSSISNVSFSVCAAAVTVLQVSVSNTFAKVRTSFIISVPLIWFVATKLTKTP